MNRHESESGCSNQSVVRLRARAGRRWGRYVNEVIDTAGYRDEVTHLYLACMPEKCCLLERKWRTCGCDPEGATPNAKIHCFPNFRKYSAVKIQFLVCQIGMIGGYAEKSPAECGTTISWKCVWYMNVPPHLLHPNATSPL